MLKKTFVLYCYYCFRQVFSHSFKPYILTVFIAVKPVNFILAVIKDNGCIRFGRNIADMDVRHRFNDADERTKSGAHNHKDAYDHSNADNPQ
jgi:hypothetical protein